VSVLDAVKDTVYIPMGLPTEIRTGTLWEMPYIEVTITDTPCRIAGIEHTIHNICYFDFNIHYANQDNFDKNFGKDVADELCNLIYDNYISVGTVYYVEVINSAKEYLEGEGKQTVFHRVVECYGMNYKI